MLADINKKLEILWALNIKTIDFDLLKGKLTFYLYDHEGKNYLLVLKGVSSLLWLRNTDNFILGFDENMFTELTSILIKDVNVDLKKDKWLKQYKLDLNISIEIVNCALLVEADEILLDGMLICKLP